MIIKILGFSFIAFGLSLVSYLLSSTYHGFIYNISDIIGVLGKEDKLQTILTERVYFLLKLLSFMPVIIGSLFVIFFKNIQLYVELRYLIFINIINKVALINKKYLLALFIVVLVSLFLRLHYAINYPISYDEAWTYINFTEKGFLSSFSYYPAPNNHVLHSVLTNISYYFPFSQTINLRFTSIFIGTLSIVLFYLSFRKFYSDNISLQMTAIFSFLFPILYYGYEARGYSLIILAFIISFYGAIELVKSESHINIKRHWTYLSFGSVLGLYSIPSFLYPYFSIVTFLMYSFVRRKNKKKLLSLLVSIFITGIITIVLYSPILVISGLEEFVGRGTDFHMSRIDVVKGFGDQFSRVSQLFFYSKWFLLPVLFLSIIALIKAGSNVEIRLAFYIIFVSPLILVLHSVDPKPRVWIYLVIPILFLLGSLFKEFINKRNIKVFGIVSAVATTLLVFNFNSYVKLHKKFSLEVNSLALYFIDHNVASIYVNHPLIETNLSYIFQEKNKLVSISYSDFDPVKDIESKKGSFEYLVLNKRYNNIHGYKFIRRMCNLESCSKAGSSTFIYSKM